MTRRSWLPLLFGLSLAGSPVLAQQNMQGPYSVALIGGMTRFDEGAALKNDPLARTLYGGIEANYYVREHLALGGLVQVSRPTTDPTMFPLNRFVFGPDTAVYFLPSQQVTLIEAGLHGLADMALGALTLIGTGGVGGYRIDLDHQRAARPVIPGQERQSLTGMSLMLGGGMSLRLPGNGGLRIMVRDFIYTGYDREILSLHEPLLASEHVPHPRQNVPEPKETIHNLRVEAALTFRPSGAGAFGGGL